MERPRLHLEAYGIVRLNRAEAFGYLINTKGHR